MSNNKQYGLVYVSGDLGRSPRMINHSLEIVT